MSNWDEIKVAYHVAQSGTVSGAAQSLGVHHATVIRHIDALEQRLGVKLFQRHARGYTPTEAGRDLMKIAQVTDDQFAQLENRIKGHGEAVEGDLIVTGLKSFSNLILPAMIAYQAEHPNLRLRYFADPRLYRLEYGEAHVAIRAGEPSQDLDNIVQSLGEIPIAMFASREYLKRYPEPVTEDTLERHRFVTFANGAARAPFSKWLAERVPESCFKFQISDERIMIDAIVMGAGLGFMSREMASEHSDLVEVMAPRDEWKSKIWLVTHMDLHRTAKVQGFLKLIKQFVKEKCTSV